MLGQFRKKNNILSFCHRQSSTANAANALEKNSVHTGTFFLRSGLQKWEAEIPGQNRNAFRTERPIRPAKKGAIIMKKEVIAVILAIAVVIILAVTVAGAGMLPDPVKLLDDAMQPNESSRDTTANSQQSAASSPYTAVQAAEESYAPVDLTSLEPYYEGAVEIERNGLTDTLGNKYRSGLRGYMSPGDPEKYNMDCFCIWDIGGQYRTLTATGIVRKKDKGSHSEGSFRIYGDGRLLYSRDGIGSMTKPYPISIDISGVHDLKIEMYGNGNMGTNGINSVLADIMLQK